MSDPHVMKIRITLRVSDAARRQVARLCPTAQRTVRGALATREAVAEYLQGRLDALSQLHPWFDGEPLRPDELEDAQSAVAVLRQAGKTDADIRAWLLLQRARYDVRGNSHE